ncbi:MAG: hypothetical protein AAGA92_13870, partial [Planctomycetota bacterium]
MRPLANTEKGSGSNYRRVLLHRLTRPKTLPAGTGEPSPEQRLQARTNHAADPRLVNHRRA